MTKAAKAIYQRWAWGDRLVRIEGALCSDGVRRSATITGEPDTFFSVPARVSVRGKTVSGFVTSEHNDANETDYKFTAYSYRNNGHLLP